MHQFVRWTTRLLGLAVGSAHPRRLRDHFLRTSPARSTTSCSSSATSRTWARTSNTWSTRCPHPGHPALHGRAGEPDRHPPRPARVHGLAAGGGGRRLPPDPRFLEALEDVIAAGPCPTRGRPSRSSPRTSDRRRGRRPLGDDAARWLAHLRTECHGAVPGTAARSMAALTRAYDEYVDDLAVFGKP